jgi:outer membrane protein assembly factor BamB
VKTRAFFPIGLTVFCVIAAAVFVAWGAPRRTLALREPGADKPGYGGAQRARTSGLSIGRDFRFFRTLGITVPGAWPGFRGPNKDNIAPSETGLSDLRDFGPERILWSVPALGEGHAGPAVAEGRVYLLDYDEVHKAEALRCLSLADGSELWRRTYPARMKRNHGYSRTVPALWDRYVVTIGPLCDVMCVDRLTGDLIWTLDAVKTFGSTVPLWYAGQCPFIDNGRLVLNVGGSVLVACIDVATGRMAWTVPNPDDARVTHASVARMSFGGRTAYLCVFSTGLFGILPPAEGGREGAIAFAVPEWRPQIAVPTPIALPGNLIYLTAGYGAGNLLVEVSPAGAAVRAGHPPGEGLSSEQQTPILLDGFLYGIETADSGELHDQLVCVRPDGAVAWASGKSARFGLGPYLLADGKLFLLSETGTLTVVEATPAGYHELSRNRVLEGVDAWGPMAVAGTRLLLRDSRRLLCVNVGR